MVAAGVGVTLLPALSVHAPVAQPPNIRVVPFRKPAPSRRIALVWRKSSALDGFLHTLADAIGPLARAQLPAL
jgi:LysR family hydrogen peroxide-inducible transcriptional activator